MPGYRGQFAVGGVEVEGGSEEENGFSHLFLDEYSLDFYLVGLVNYRWKNWRFHLDVFDGTIGRSTTFTLTDKSILDAKVQLLMPRLFAGYNFLYKKSPIGPITNWQLYMGGRMYYVNLEISLPRNLGIKEGNKSWFTFLIGTEITLKIFKRLSFIASGDIGGFAASNKSDSIRSGYAELSTMGCVFGKYRLCGNKY